MCVVRFPIDAVGAALGRQYRDDLAVEAACLRARTAAEHDLEIARQRRRVSEAAYRAHCAGEAA